MKADVYERITGQIVGELEKGVRPSFKWLLYEGGTKYERTPGRCAHTYVFAWNGFSDDEADHRNPAQWVFYVVPVFLLRDGQKTISLSKIARLAAPVPITGLGAAVTKVAASHQSP